MEGERMQFADGGHLMERRGVEGNAECLPTCAADAFPSINSTMGVTSSIEMVVVL